MSAPDNDEYRQATPSFVPTGGFQHYPKSSSTSIGGPVKGTAQCKHCPQVCSIPDAMRDHLYRVHGIPALILDNALDKTMDVSQPKRDDVNDPAHYGGKDNPYEVIKVLKAWGFFNNSLRFNSIKYLARAGKKDSDLVKELRKAIYYIQAEITEIEKGTAS